MIKLLSFLVIIISLCVYNYLQVPLSTPINTKATHTELTQEGKLLNSTGSLIETGFARRPIKTLNEEEIFPFILGNKRLNFLRYKKWDFFDVINEDFQLLVWFVDLGYVGSAQAILYENKTGKLYQVVQNVHNIFKIPNLPSTSNIFQGQFSYNSDSISLQVEYKQSQNEERQVQVNVKTSNLQGQIILSKPKEHEEVVMVSPINAQHTMFYYNTKSYCLKVEGEVVYEGKKTNLGNGKSLGGRDIGRGVWNYYSFWFWAHFQGFTNVEGKQMTIGINLGNGFEHQSTNTYEDSIILNGRLHKLQIVNRKVDEQNMNQPWEFSTEHEDVRGSFKAVFIPKQTNVKNENFVVIHAMFNQYFGSISGWFIDENGVKINFENIQGFSEYHRAKW